MFALQNELYGNGWAKRFLPTKMIRKKSKLVHDQGKSWALSLFFLSHMSSTEIRVLSAFKYSTS